MLGTKGRKLFGLTGALLCGTTVVYICIRMMPREASATGAVPPSETRETTGDKQHEAVFLSEALKKKPDHAPVLMRLAQMSAQSGKHEDAIRYLKEILDREPANVDARLELGKSLFESGDVQGAVEQTKNILEKQPAHADALYNLGAIYANLGNTTLALEYWNRLLASNPKSESGQRARTLVAQLPDAPNPVAVNLDSHVIHQR
jgi:tetratricopeptide (TPR) repeat protein